MTGWLPSANSNITFLKTCSVRFRRRKPRAKSICSNPTTRGTSSPNRIAIFVRPFSSCPTMFVLPRGKPVSQPSEHLLRESTEALLKEIYQHYDYVIIDSSPVLAADDTTSLAPKIDATLFVVRLSYTSARLTKKALELLYGRQVNVPGVILNFVDTSLPEYYYYQYSEYYSTPIAPPESE